MHPLDGPRLKILRAKEQIGSLYYETQRFFNREIGAARVGKLNPKTDLYDLEISAPEDLANLTLPWSVRIGEIAHNLRSALDGLVYQLALSKHPNPARTQFPIFFVGRIKGCRGKCNSRKPPHFVCRGRKSIELLYPQHQAAIRQFQPYKRGNGYRRSPLWQLHEMNNTDKHRLILVVASWVGGVALTPLNQDIRRIILQSGMPLKPNTKIGEIPIPHKQMDMYASAFYEIRFGEGCDAVKGLPAIHTLLRIADKVDQIVQSFSGDFA